MTPTPVRDDLFERVLLSPLKEAADELHILTGYASADFALFHLLEAREHLGKHFSVRLHVGMTGADGISHASHLGFLAAQEAVPGAWLRVAYAPAGTYDHSKIYVWLSSGTPVAAWLGSANYSHSAFGIDRAQRETMVVADPIATSRVLQEATVNYVQSDAKDVYSRVEIYEVVEREQRIRIEGPTRLASAPDDSAKEVRLPLVQTTKNPGEVHNAGAGLNWGQRGNRRRAEAYIPVPAIVARSGFFPQRGIPFAVYADDGATLFLTVAQDGDKALHSVPDNAAIGLWLRRRLGVQDDAFVTTEDLLLYGSTELTFTVGPDGDYHMRF